MSQTTFKLRPYQKNAVAAVLARYRGGERRLLLHLPTGAGKTVIATHAIQALAGLGLRRCLFVAHRREILDQTARTLERHLPTQSLAVEQGSRSALELPADGGGPDIVLASVQSLLHRKERYNPAEFDLIICDECHRALAPSWEQVIGYFWSQARPHTLLLGMTATPRRTDGRSALALFGEPAFEISRTDLEDLGYLVPMAYFTVQGDLRLDRVKLSGGDFQGGALSQVMDTPQHRALAVKAWQEQGLGRRTIAFCAGVEHAEHLAQDFAQVGVRAAKIDGKTKERQEVLARFAAGEIQVLTNYGVLTEGFDDPGVSCILMARPTTSPLVYTQCVGRGLRSASGKTECTVIDLVDRSTHQLQYDAIQMAGLPSKWRCRGGDPFRQARSLSGIKVTTPEAFLKLREATSLEDVHTILMSLPAGVVVAGMDGEPLLRYEPRTEPLSRAAAQAEAEALLEQAGVEGARLQVTSDRLSVRFADAEVERERYGYLAWHLGRVTQRPVHFETGGRKRQRNLRAILASMLPEYCRLGALSRPQGGDAIQARIDGLAPHEVDSLAREFQGECGLKLELKGQMSLF